MPPSQRQADAAVAAAAAAKALRAQSADVRRSADVAGVARIGAIVTAYAKSRQSLSDGLVKHVGDAVRRFRAWYSPHEITALTTGLARDVEAAQRLTASLTDAYLSRLATAQTGRRVPPAGRIDVTDLRGKPTPAVYGRLADNYRYLVSTGVEPDVAQERVVHRAEVMADEDATLAMRHQSQASLAAIDDGEIHIIVGYRRLIHPELSHKTGVCALCLIASDRIYTVGELLPIHSLCHCSVAPVFHDSDPGDQLNQDDLAAIYKAAGSNRAGDLIKVRIHQHHELGAILTNAAHSFRPAPAGA